MSLTRSLGKYIFKVKLVAILKFASETSFLNNVNCKTLDVKDQYLGVGQSKCARDLVFVREVL